MKAIGYIRLSFKDQSKYSLEVQEAAIKAYCFRHHLKLEALFKDNGQSSATFDRIDFKALESFMKKHKGTIHYLIVMAHDRFSRDLPEALLKIRTLENQFGLKVLSVDEPLDLDTKDPNVLASRTFKYLNANTELMNIRARTKNAILGAQLAGRFINKAPYGYRNDRDFTDKSLLTIIADQATVVHQIFHYYLLDVPVAQIKLEAMKIGFCYKGHNAIYRILGNCVYAGLIRLAHDNGTYTYVKALHEPIIKETDFWLVQERLNKKTTKTKRDKDFPLRGLLKCHCTRYMTAAWSKGNRKHYVYYCCYFHRDINVPGLKVHDQLDHLLKRLELSAPKVARLTDKAKERLAVLLYNQEQQIASRQATIKDLDKKMENLEEAFIDKHIAVDMFKKWSERYRIERQKLEVQISELNQDNCDQRERMQQFIKKLSNLHQIYLNATCLQKHVLLKHIFKHGFTYVNGQLKAVSISSILLDDNEIETFPLKNNTTAEFAEPIVHDERLHHKAEEHFFIVLGELIAELEFNNLGKEL